MHAQIPENHWQCECSKSDDPGTNAGTHYPCIFRNLCVKGAMDRQQKKELKGIGMKGKFRSIKRLTNRAIESSKWKAQKCEEARG